VHSYPGRTNDLNLCPVEQEPSFNISKVTKLRDLVFRPGWETIEWITEAIRTITPEHRDLQQITVYVPYSLSISNHDTNTPQTLQATSMQWSDLDHLLVQLWESRSIRPRVGCSWSRGEGEHTDDCIAYLFPEITKRGIVELV